MSTHNYNSVSARLQTWIGQIVNDIYFKPAAIAIFLSIFFIVFVIASELTAADAHSAAIINSQMDNRSGYQASGSYSAPRRVSIGQRITKEEFIASLLSTGYLEKDEPEEFSTGNFVAYENVVKFCTSKAVRNDDLPPCLSVTIEKNRIMLIEDPETGCRLISILLPAKMLTNDVD